MRTIVILPVLFLCGCWHTATQDDTAILCECFATAAYEAVRNEAMQADAEQVCCGKCNNTGKVRSGDGLAMVDCPCPQTCKCKHKGAKR